MVTFYFNYAHLNLPNIILVMYNRYVGMYLSGFYVEGAQGRILAILNLKLSETEELLSEGIFYSRFFFTLIIIPQFSS
jgi:hypothetical protein